MTNTRTMAIAVCSVAALAALGATTPAQAKPAGSGAGSASSAASNSASNRVSGVVAAGNGIAGLEQRVDVVAPKLANTTVEVVAYSGEAYDVAYAPLNAKGQGSTLITPTASGTWTVAASGPGLSLTGSTITVEAMPTIDYVYVPDKAARYVPMGLISTIHAADGNAPINGTVTFYEASLGRLGEVKVSSQTPVPYVLADFAWTPPDAGTYAFHTVFQPENDPDTGTPAVQASDSGTSYLTVEEHPVRVQLLMPPVMRIGHPALVIAQLPDMYRGTISLLVDDRAVSPDKETVDGIAAFDWVPLHTGLTDVQVELHHERLPRVERVVTQTVDVQPRLLPNPISVTPVINGVAGAPWADDDVLDYPAGTKVSLVMSTGNGSGVVLEQHGQCMLNGTTLTVSPTGGGCTVTFRSVGDAKYADNSAQVLITSSLAAASAPARPPGSKRAAPR